MKSFMANPMDIERKWFVIDAEGKILGRLAAEVAKILRGKNKPTFTPHVDTGDFVVIINAEKVIMSGNKLTDKTYFQHSGYPGGTRFTTYGKLRAEKPERLIEIAVKGMLPHNTLGASMFKKLKVYRGAAHPHAAQSPETLELNIR